MKQFTVFKDNDTYRLLYVNDKLEQVDYGELKGETILPRVEMIEKWIDDLKSPEELKIEELETVRQRALSFVQEQATDEQKLEMIDLFDEFQSDHEYKKGDEFKWNGSIYRVLQAHTSQEYWKPDEAVSLYVDIANKIEIQEFKQPTGQHDAYQIGDEILFDGFVWQSIINDNVWSPNDYPQGWQKIREI